MSARRGPEPHGVAVIDKPSGPTSHDVVARMRRALGTRKVGHAGTLDPMASGVMIVMAGEATKLGPYLTADDKIYEARVVLGRATDTLDALGATTLEAPVEPALAEALRRGELGPLAPALEAELARTSQVPPAYAAIHVNGVRSYELARAGVAVELAPRAVRVLALEVLGVARGAREPETHLEHELALDVRLHVTKGYYVRSFARDFGLALGAPAHLGALRRLASGPFDLARATPLDVASRDGVPLVSVAEAACAALASATLTDEGAARARQGKRLDDAHFERPPERSPAAWLDRAGGLVAIGERATGEADEAGPTYRVLRGFGATSTPADADADAG